MPDSEVRGRRRRDSASDRVNTTPVARKTRNAAKSSARSLGEILIPSHAMNWDLADFPMLTRLEDALDELGWERLRDLHGKDFYELYQVLQPKPKEQIEEFKLLIQCIEYGVFDPPVCKGPKEIAQHLVRLIDEAVQNLPDNESKDLKTRFKADGANSSPESDVETDFEITSRRVARLDESTLDFIYRSHGPVIKELLIDLSEHCDKKGWSISEALFDRWISGIETTPMFPAGFYVGMWVLFEPALMIETRIVITRQLQPVNDAGLPKQILGLLRTVFGTEAIRLVQRIRT